jgi:hypothetical protein
VFFLPCFALISSPPPIIRQLEEHSGLALGDLAWVRAYIWGVALWLLTGALKWVGHACCLQRPCHGRWLQCRWTMRWVSGDGSRPPVGRFIPMFFVALRGVRREVLHTRGTSELPLHRRYPCGNLMVEGVELVLPRRASEEGKHTVDYT